MALPHDEKGFIPRRELSWAIRPPHPRQIVKEGQEIPCYLLAYDESRSRWNVSLCRALGDPWEKFLKVYDTGMVIRGRIVKVMPFGLFIEIMEGVEGLVPRSDLNVDEDEDLEQHFWVGDHVAAVITRIDMDRRRVSLSLRKYRAALDEQEQKKYLQKSKGVTLGEQLGISVTALKRAMGMEEEKPMDLKIQRPHVILLAEDDKDVRESVALLLRRAGHTVIEAEDKEEVLKALKEREDIDLVLLDVDMPGSNGYQISREIARICPHIPIVLMTGLMWDTRRLAQQSDARIVGYIHKPFSDTALLKLVEQAIEHPEELREATWQTFQVAVQAQDKRTNLLLRKDSDALPPLLAGLRARTHAEWVGLFSFDKETRRVGLVASSSDLEVDLDTTKYELEYSPVRDVAEDGDTVFETYISKHSPRRFQKLRAAFPCESCIGVPVEVDGEAAYALFLFHRTPRAFHKGDKQDARLTALRIAMLLEREQFKRELFAFHQHFLMGQLTAGLTHEVNNKLQSLLFDARLLRSDLRKELTAPLGSLEYLSYKDAQEQRIQRITDVIYSVAQTVSLFRNLMRQEQRTAMDVNTISGRATEIVRLEAQRSGISIDFIPDPSIPRVQGTPVHLEQALVNVILNAVQQMALAGRKGKVEVRTAYEPEDPDGLPVKIRVIDQGPGIHAKLFEEIFKLGFTTRAGGTGMGLYITRALVENMGGRVRVEESLITIGTTFVVELPVQSAKGVKEGEQE